MSDDKYITCEHCGAFVYTGLRQPEGTEAEIEEWWDDIGAESWCPVYGEFRHIITHGHRPCEA